MCGIYITNIDYSQDKVHKKLEGIKFRGPDNIGIEKNNAITIGHLRLSILDLNNRSHQPMHYKHLSITYNGEVYNYDDVKKELISLGYEFETESDTEVLLIGYYEWKEKVLDKINGMFAFSIYNSQANTIFSARDRLGVKPFYYYWKDGKFEICSQLRPLITSNSKINNEAISIYLDCGYIPSPHSAIEHIYKLPPGHFLKIDLNSNTINSGIYWDLNKTELTTKSYREAKEEIHDLLLDAVKIRLRSDVPIGSFLSGGIDSALVSALATKISDKPINTFSIGFENKKFDESQVAEQYAEILGTNHKTILCKIEDVLDLIPKYTEVYDEPFADSSGLPSLLLNKTTKQYVTVALSGDGGDESFIGYDYFSFLKKNKIIFLIPLAIRKVLVKLKVLDLLRGISRKSIPEKLFLTKNINQYIIGHFTGYDSFQKRRSTSWLTNYNNFKRTAKHYLQRAADLNIKLWLENDSNVKVDRASMAYSVEVRSPFLDYRVVEKARTFPIKYRYRDNVRKKILRDILKDYIPESVFDQPKKGFSVPLGEWMRNELKDEITSNLNDDFLNFVPNLNIEKFKERLNKHMNNEADYKTNVWKLYVLRKWYEEFGFYPKNKKNG
ncbi:asparagine synthase (glutamine-hydrolyzing) [Seonamhaeicola marinus]|uniref:asparagine synthase (glutamine-hydrolyzing) n=1 Tax=Seonamhaeicola marinus TaxID=1912246 RepID=A0A5D0HKS7_9FLAO|nr:asparagine synthase (glutamine-hydrolyzing) [Seonamhaeicola marinus]TYA71865.1 asparagine synthase (glutamine-hydrolyzing) [Seonamhaeicola marinus]